MLKSLHSMTKISNKNPRIGVYRPQPEGFKAFVLESFPPKIH